ncbi:MAG TPA: ATP-grasp domain-containing protein [Sphingobium sp.]
MKALVTGAGAVLGQGIIKSLRQSTLDCTIVAADPNPLSSGLHWADTAYRLPMAADIGFGGRIAELLDRERPDVVMVGTDVELSWFAAHRADLEATFGTHVLVSDPRVIAIADDKLETARFFDRHGLNPPASVAGEHGEAVDALVEAVGFPLVVKPRIGARSVGVSVVHDRAALDQALSGRSGLVVQECIGDESCEYTASVLVFDGAVQASIVMRRDLRDGNTYRAYTGDYEELNRAVRAFGAALQPYGPANFQFRLDEEGLPRVFEINGRFSGTTPMRAMAGFNEVEMCVRHILDGTPIVQPSIKPGVILRHLEEMFVPQSQVAAVL